MEKLVTFIGGKYRQWSFFGFNRPEITRRNLERILDAKPAKLYLVSDGPRSGRQEDLANVERVRAILDRVPQEFEVIRIYSDSNLGLKARFESALDLIFATESHAIILEDDCLVEPGFFLFAAEALKKFRDCPQIGAVSAHRPISRLVSGKIHFDEYLRVWGWATWSHQWRNYRANSTFDLSDSTYREKVLKRIRPRTLRFMARQFFNNQVELESWAVPLCAFFYLRSSSPSARL